MQYSKDAKVRSFIILIAIFKVWRITHYILRWSNVHISTICTSCAGIDYFQTSSVCNNSFLPQRCDVALNILQGNILEWHLRLDHLRSAMCVYLAYHGSLGWWTRSPFSYGDRHFSNPCRFSSERTFSSTLDLAAEVFCSSRTTKEIKTKF